MLQMGQETVIKGTKGEIIQIVWQQELSFLYTTHPHDLFNINVKYDENISKGIHDIKQTRKQWIMPGSLPSP